MTKPKYRPELPKEAWPGNWPVLTCTDCGVTNKSVVVCVDPYHIDIDNIVLVVKLCDECYHQACQDI